MTEIRAEFGLKKVQRFSPTVRSPPNPPLYVKPERLHWKYAKLAIHRFCLWRNPAYLGKQEKLIPTFKKSQKLNWI